MLSRRHLFTCAAAAASRPLTAKPVVARRFIYTDRGQIHVRIAGESIAGGSPPIFCFHQSPQSSLVFAEILPLLASGRLAVACDTPGFGESFRPDRQPTITDYATWLAEVPAALGFAQIDVVGMFTGTAIAVELQIKAPTLVRRMALIGPALFDEAQRRVMLANAWPERPGEDGGFLMREWRRVFDRYPKNMPFEQRFAAFNEYYRGGVNAIFGEVAVNSYDMPANLPKVTSPVLIIDPDGTFGRGEAAHKLLRRSTYVRAEGKSGLGLLQTEAPWVAEHILQFFDQPGAGGN